ncbi:MAG: hypothetical protein ACXVCY_02185 [Pseudobdellovibrionaceae bacterium]
MLIKRALFGCLSLAVFTLNTAKVSAFELFPYPTFTGKREFTVLAPREIIPVQTRSSLSVFIFKSAYESCSLNLDEVQKRFDDILNAKGILFNSLANLFSNSQNSIYSRLSKKLVIAVDDFGERRGVFNSFFLSEVVDTHGSPHSMIVLDCTQMARGYWLPSLAHEITHALFAYEGERHSVDVPDSWFEEGLAELMEVNAGGMQPEMDTHVFAKTSPANIPTLLETRRPLLSKENYALSYLFVEYLYYRWGGWEMLRAMTGQNSLSAESPCHSRLDFLDHASCLAQNYFSNQSRPPALTEKMTRNGLLRYFAVALTLNLSSYPMYSIPGWSGWTDLSMEPQTLNSVSSIPGQIQILPDSQNTLDYLRNIFLSQSSDSIEAYQINSSGEHFTIAALNPTNLNDRKSARQNPFWSSEKRFILLLNLEIGARSYFWTPRSQKQDLAPFVK